MKSRSLAAAIQLVRLSRENGIHWDSRRSGADWDAVSAQELDHALHEIDDLRPWLWRYGVVFLDTPLGAGAFRIAALANLQATLRRADADPAFGRKSLVVRLWWTWRRLRGSAIRPAENLGGAPVERGDR